MKKLTRQELFQQAHELTLELYRMVHCGPQVPEFELSVEIRKAAQDTARYLMSEMDPDQTLDAASGASARLECLLLLANDMGYFPKAGLAEFQKRAGEIGTAIRKMMSRLRTSGS